MENQRWGGSISREEHEQMRNRVHRALQKSEKNGSAGQIKGLRDRYALAGGAGHQQPRTERSQGLIN